MSSRESNDRRSHCTTTHIELTSNQVELIASSAPDKVAPIRTELETSPQDLNAFDVARYLPPGIQVQFVERGGALFVPHRINEFAIKILKRRVDLVCFWCCLRFTLGFSRPAAKLSHGFMAKWTGLLPQNVRRGLQSLKDMGLIRVLVTPTNSTSTIYEVPIVKGYLDWKAQREEESKGPIKMSTPTGGVYSDRVPRGNQPEFPGIISLSTKKENSNKNRNLSQREEILPHKIKAYIAAVKPRKKQIEEEYHLQQLIEDYPIDDIHDALDFVQSKGALDTAEAVHSPMKYLCFVMEQVITEISKEKARITRGEELRRKFDLERMEQEDRRVTEAKEMTDALAAFAALDAREQEAHIIEFKRSTYGGHALEPPENVTRNLTAKRWFAAEAVRK